MDEEEYRKGIEALRRKVGNAPYNRFAEESDPQPARRDPALLRRARERYEQYQAEKREALRVAED